MATHAAQGRVSSGSYALLVACLKSTRPMSSLVAGTLSSAVIWARTGISVRVVLVGLAMTSVTAFGFVVNDILDYDKDTAAAVKRPIAAGMLPRKGAFILAIMLLLAAALLSVTLGCGGTVLSATALALILYTPCARRLPLIKGIYVAVLCVAPLYYASVVSRTSYSWISYVALATFVAGREALMDSDEVAGDRAAGMVTIAVLCGETRTRRIGTWLMALALAFLIVIATGRIGKAAAVVSLVSLLIVFTMPHLHESKRIELSRIPMLAAAVGIACS